MAGGDEFVWRGGRAEVTLSRADDAWMVVYTAVGRLKGPRQVIYEGKHREAVHAAWDFMARVGAASRDKNEGLKAGESAAFWLRKRVQPAEVRAPRDLR